MNPQEKFQSDITRIVREAANNGVHPAIVYMVLGGIQADVLHSVRAANQIADEVGAAETVLNTNPHAESKTIQPETHPDQRPGDN